MVMVAGVIILAGSNTSKYSDAGFGEISSFSKCVVSCIPDVTIPIPAIKELEE
jgi:hypothetical protein